MPETTQTAETTIRCRCDGRLNGVYGPVTDTFRGPEDLANVMVWEYAGDAAAVLDKAWSLLREGKAVKLTSHAGVSIFQPLEADEDGCNLARSGRVVYDVDGTVVERTV